MNGTYKSDTFTFFLNKNLNIAIIFCKKNLQSEHKVEHKRTEVFLHTCKFVHTHTHTQSSRWKLRTHRDVQQRYSRWTYRLDKAGDTWVNQGAYTHLTQNFTNISFDMYIICTFMHSYVGPHTHKILFFSLILSYTHVRTKIQYIQAISQT